jgi:hypothetical protein
MASKTTLAPGVWTSGRDADLFLELRCKAQKVTALLKSDLR